MVDASQIVEEARTWIGVPWRHQGRSRLGVDCIGLAVMVARAFKLPHTDRTDYARSPVGMHLESHLLDNLRRGVPGVQEEGQIALFSESRYPCHVGILSRKHGILHVIHALVSHRKVIEEPLQQCLSARRLTGVYDFPGVETWRS